MLKSTRAELLTWEELKFQFVIRKKRKMVTGNPIADDILNRFVFWAQGPIEIQNIVKKFIICAAEREWSKYPFTIYELNYLKWYVGQYIAAMPKYPDRWDEKLNSIKRPSELAQFVKEECIPNSIDPF